MTFQSKDYRALINRTEFEIMKNNTTFTLEQYGVIFVSKLLKITTHVVLTIGVLLTYEVHTRVCCIN